MTEEEVKARFAQLSRGQAGTFESFKNEANTLLRPMKIEFRKDRSDFDGRIYYCLATIRGTTDAEFGSSLDDKMLNFMKILVVLFGISLNDET
eukprot:CAMPEP_0184503922 /NCGR_PEP_ID=MMETSP0113_2-20130426/52180_1 /TAXON_ID=91329 /ORGANISM="Norrisiella sphaerica, Strain BC52" /LENGTH=92 /DNA_ID=CAMNT_0026893511 /DNA_START=75 /DNA_END=353 /DNA_ORIENTATION=+